MRISAKCDYACRALLELALHSTEEGPLQINDIASHQDIPLQYLMQILIQLKHAGLVASSRGKAGGYYLANRPDQVRLGDVIRAIDGPLMPIKCVNKGSPEVCSIEAGCVFREVWGDVEEAMAAVVDNITFEDIANRVRMRDRVVMYQI